MQFVFNIYHIVIPDCNLSLKPCNMYISAEIKSEVCKKQKKTEGGNLKPALLFKKTIRQLTI